MHIALLNARHVASAFKGTQGLRTAKVSTNHSMNPPAVRSVWVLCGHPQLSCFIHDFLLSASCGWGTELGMAPTALLQVPGASLSAPTRGLSLMLLDVNYTFHLYASLQILSTQNSIWRSLGEYSVTTRSALHTDKNLATHMLGLQYIESSCYTVSHIFWRIVMGYRGLVCYMTEMRPTENFTWCELDF